MAWFRMMGADSVDYHGRTVLARGDDHEGQAVQYYGSRGETPLMWGGQIAERLGLVGVVDAEAYEAIFGQGGARDPHLGTRLAKTTRPGVELVVAAHKTVAVLGLIGRADDMHAILDAETDATMAFLEAWFARQGGRRGRSQRRTPTGGLLWARTRHVTSRAGDPAPHDHVLIANLTEMLDRRGGWKALDTGGLRDLVHAATMAGRLASAAKAVELGYAIEPDHGPSGKLDHWALAGIPAAVTGLFSKRAAEIDAAIEAEGFSSYRARGVAARDTRAAKSDETPESLLVRWYEELDSIGWPTRKIERRLRLVNERRAQPLRTLTDTERTAVVNTLIGPAGPLAERKAFTRPDVVRLAAPLLYGCAADELDAVVSGVLRHPEAIPLVGQPGARGRAWAAASALAIEAAVEEIAERLTRRAAAAAIAPAQVDAACSAHEAIAGRPLTEGQGRAVDAITTGGRGLDLVVGVAGSGKTTALGVVRAAFEHAGYRVLGTATSGQAARGLASGAGVESRTIASLVWRLEHDQIRLDERTVLIVDEAGMTDDNDLLKLLAAADVAKAKVVMIGDHRQLGAVGPGGGLEALINRHGPAVHVLDENVRQHDPEERRTLERLRSGDVADATEWYGAHGRVVPAPTRADALEAAVDAWASDRERGSDTTLLAWRRRDVAALNRLARQRAINAGEVAGPELETADGKRYAAGDRVVALAPAQHGRVVTSQRGNVLSAADDELRVRLDDGAEVVLSGEELAGDRFAHAYALTVHRMQGATVDHAHVFADGGGRELAYVAMSRARQGSHIYVVADDADQAVEDLAREWSVDRRERWVIDTDTVADDSARRRPDLARGGPPVLRSARLRAEQQAVEAVAPWATDRLRALTMERRATHLEQRPAEASGLGLAR